MTVSLTLTFADLAQAEQAIAALRALNSPDLSLVQASAAEDRPPASAATNQPETATISSSLNTFSGIGSARETSAMLHPGVVDGPTASLAGRDSGDSVERHAPNSSPATSQGADGHPEPSSDALPAGPLKGAANGKSGHAVTNSPEREPGSPEVCAISIPMRVSSGTSRPAARAHLNAENQASPAGEPIKRERKPMRPHCLRPEMCGGYGRKHCGPCERAAGAQAA